MACFLMGADTALAFSGEVRYQPSTSKASKHPLTPDASSVDGHTVQLSHTSTKDQPNSLNPAKAPETPGPLAETSSKNDAQGAQADVSVNQTLALTKFEDGGTRIKKKRKKKELKEEASSEKATSDSAPKPKKKRKEPKGDKEPKEGKGAKEPKGSKGPKGIREPKEPKGAKGAKEPKELKGTKEPKQPKEPKCKSNTTPKTKASKKTSKEQGPTPTEKKKKGKRKNGVPGENSEQEQSAAKASQATEELTDAQKRRSGRQVKRRKYNEDLDFKVVDDAGETIAVLGAGRISPNSGSSQKGNQTTENQEEDESAVIEKILAMRTVQKESPGGKLQEIEEFYVKYRNYSYLHCKWATVEELEKDKRIHQKIKRFRTKRAQMKNLFVEPDEEPFNPDYIEVDRILDVAHTIDTETSEPVTHYLVKWCSLPYEESTWELVEDIDPAKIQEYEDLQIIPEVTNLERPPAETWKKLELSRPYKADNKLREYQLEGMNWLLFNWYNRKNCILADEMGLGKTIQSITFLYEIYLMGIRGPFLIIAPLSTIANWEREFRTWTEVNVIVYHGSQISRQMIHQYEMHYKDSEGAPIQGLFKFNAIITTFEMILADCPELRKIQWSCVVIDEAHRLKNRNCKLLEGLKLMALEHKVLLTGTPLQNTVEELFSLLNFLEPVHFPSESTFMEEFGDLKTDEQVKKLQAVLKPMMLRRLKDDVEKNLAPKEETIIEVELTNIQKKYYRAILERNFSFLAKGANQANMPNLLNTMMELRKCCNHPYLINGAEEKILDEFREVHNPDAPDFQLQAMIQAAGKLVLIDKLLPKLIAGGHKVLIFSQMVRCLDILEDYLIHRRYTYERIDGRVRGNLRQAAIDRFSKPDSDRFVFLLCTRAGGLGINLTAADTCIIFDSDWNPQNDLQAQARCHRIGQNKAVQVYRLITRNSYEREMFDKASLKLGLDRAVLQAMNRKGNTNGVQPLSKIEVEDLLRKGAYGALMDEEDEGSKFCEEDIDQILLRRTRTITIESEGKGSTFAKASFVASGNRTDISLDDPNFWQKWAKIAELDIESKNGKDSLVIDTPRVRKQTKHYNSFEDDELMEFSELDSDSEDRPSRSRRLHDKTRRYLRAECFRVEKNLLIFGWGRWKDILSHGRFKWHLTEKDMETICRTLLVYCLKHYKGDEKIKSFIWDLITPTKDGQNQALHNHSGLSAPVPRGRKGKKMKTPLSQPELKNADWVATCNPDVLFHDDGYKKHLKQHCNKVLLRVRMLYYLKQEVLGEAADKALDGIDASKLEVWIPDVDYNDVPVDWWGGDSDKSLLIGVYKHGYERYNAMRADPALCFLERVGMPDETSLAAEQGGVDLPSDITEGVDLCKGDDSESKLDGQFKDQPDEDANSCTESGVMEKGEDSILAQDGTDIDRPQWPVASVLTARLRRLITAYQRCNRKELVRMESLARNSRRRWYPQDEIWGRVPEMDIVTMDIQQRWTRREQTDFYRVVSTFGVVYDPDRKQFNWNQFRSFAKLERKTDGSLERYFRSFMAMCRNVCRLPQRKEEPSDPSIFVEPITEERASRTLYRIELLRKVREQVLRSPQLNERLKLCRPSLYLPVWWECGKHDRDLLIGTAKHGLSRTDYYILNDPQLSFREAHRNYVQNGSSYFQNVPAPYSQSSLNLSQSASPASTVLTLGEKDNIEQIDAEQEKMEEALEQPSPEAGTFSVCLEVKSEEDAADSTSRCDAFQAKPRPSEPDTAGSKWSAVNCIQAGFYKVPNAHTESKGTSDFSGNCKEDNGVDSLQNPILKSCTAAGTVPMENLQPLCVDANQATLNCLNFLQVKSNGVLKLQTVSEEMVDSVAPVCGITGTEPVVDTVLGVIAKCDLAQHELVKAENGCTEDKRSIGITDREAIMIEHTYDVQAKYLGVGHTQTAANGIDKPQVEISPSDSNSPAALPRGPEVINDLKPTEVVTSSEWQAVAVNESSSRKEAESMTSACTRSDHAPFEAVDVKCLPSGSLSFKAARSIVKMTEGEPGSPSDHVGVAPIKQEVTFRHLLEDCIKEHDSLCETEEKSEEDGSQPEGAIPLKNFDEESNTSTSLGQDEIQDNLLQDIREPTIAQLLQEKTLYSSAEWPKDRVIINRIDNICHAVLKGKWPSAQQQSLEPQGGIYSTAAPAESLNVRSCLNVPVQATHTLSIADGSVSSHQLTKESLLALTFPRDQRRRRRKYEFETDRGAKRKNLEEVSPSLTRPPVILNGWQETAMDLSKASEEVSSSVPVIISTSTPKLGSLEPSTAFRADMAGILQAGLVHPVTGQVINGAFRGDDTSRRRRGRRKNVEGVDILFMKEKKPENLEMDLSKQLFSGAARSADNMMIKLPQGKQRLPTEEEQKNKSLIEWLRQHPTYTMDVSNLAPNCTAILHGLSERPKQRRHRCKDPSKLDINTLTGEERVPVVHKGSGRKLGGAMAPLIKELARWLDANPDYAVAPEWAEIVKHSGFLPESKFSRILTEPVVKEAGSRKRGRRPRSEMAKTGGVLTETATAMGPMLMNGLIAGMDLVSLQNLRNIHNLQLAGLMGFPAGFAAIPSGEDGKSSLNMLPMMLPGVAGMSHVFGVGGLLNSPSVVSSTSTSSTSTLTMSASSKVDKGSEQKGNAAESMKHGEGSSSGDKPGPSSSFHDSGEARVTTSNPLSFNPFLLHSMPAGLIYPSMFLPHGIGMAMPGFAQAGHSEAESTESPKKKRKKAKEETANDGTETSPQQTTAEVSTGKSTDSTAMQDSSGQEIEKNSVDGTQNAE
ncbi:chromodomain-helicase-DNA-binding protein 6 isoform X1 [Carcharodon carcharias]|uniref:chromodomain-helicase-DNA-binding protein 6 isoform X1 n=1 Tax=Carcharodon carcharias TaxID=13397 RepID=UPI001B7ED2D6|nr:chromodomain-helicase-DNA-binding protein 6 isoform X1 [Carcharodon carcharias]